MCYICCFCAFDLILFLMLIGESCAFDVHVDVMMKRVWSGKVVHVQASQVTVRAVSGKVVTSTLYVASVVGVCSTLHYSLHQRFDVTYLHFATVEVCAGDV